jgi:hypothetical protein
MYCITVTSGWPWTRWSALYSFAPPTAWMKNDARNIRRNVMLNE